MSVSDEEQFDSLILIALIAFFGWTYWQKKNLATSQVETAKVQQLMDEANASADNPNALSSVTASADKIVKDDIDSVQAIQTQFVLAKLAYEKQDYAAAEKALKKVENSKVKDEGLIQVVKLRLADAQLAQNK